MKTFAQRRADRVAELQASKAYDANAPHPIVSPVSKLPREPIQLHTVARSVLVYCLEALEQPTDARRQVAARMLREELGASSLPGRER